MSIGCEFCLYKGVYFHALTCIHACITLVELPSFGRTCSGVRGLGVSGLGILLVDVARRATMSILFV